jgi:D-3-phosphoglycerate dehydrogenase
MYTIVVTDDRYGSYVQENTVLKEIGTEVRVHDFSEADKEEAAAVLREADGVLVNLFPLTGDIIRKMKRCRVISRYGVGYDNVDVGAATEMGIQVTRVPDYCSEDVSDHALALLLSCIRKVAYKDRLIRRGEWNLHKDYPCFRIKGKVLGIVGYGGGGRALHRKVSGFGLAKVLVDDPYVPDNVIFGSGAEPANLATVLRESDYVSIHAPLSEETFHLMNSGTLGMMKRGAILINTARGPLVEEEALCAALKAGTIAGAALDVFEEEPLGSESSLRDLDTVILSDHTAWYSEESLFELKTKAARNILEVLTGTKPTYPVNTLM